MVLVLVFTRLVPGSLNRNDTKKKEATPSQFLEWKEEGNKSSWA